MAMSSDQAETSAEPDVSAHTAPKRPKRKMPMAKFIVRFSTQIDIAVTIEVDDEIDAEDKAWVFAENYLKTVHGDDRGVTATATLDGTGSYSSEAQEGDLG
jgi:hypothetical protein